LTSCQLARAGRWPRASLGKILGRDKNMSTTLEATAAVKVEWVVFPFTYLGRSYNSKVKAKTRGLRDIEALPAGRFATINEECLRDISNITASSSTEYIICELERLNKGNSWAILELAGE